MCSRVLCIPLLSQYHLWSDSTTQKQVALDIPGLDGLLPHSEALWVESLTTGCANGDIDWNIIGYAGFDRNSELAGQPFFNIAGAGVTLVGSQRNDATAFTSSFYRQHLWRVRGWRPR